MPSEMFERGRRDAEADALEDNYYHYYYDYKLGYDEVLRNRRRSRRQLFLRRLGLALRRLLPLLLVAAGLGFAGYYYLSPRDQLAAVGTPTPTPTLRPTIPLPTPAPRETPTVPLALRPNGFAVIAGTQGLSLNGRKAPGRNNPVVVKFRERQTVKVLEGPQEAGGLAWWRVELDGKSGWAAGNFLKPVPAPR